VNVFEPLKGRLLPTAGEPVVEMIETLCAFVLCQVILFAERVRSQVGAGAGGGGGGGIVIVFVHIVEPLGPVAVSL